jgi:putative ABC transport system permease protein
VRPIFLLRWSLRDLRLKWLQVAAIALVIAIGTGVYSALSSTATWRRESNDASFAAAGMYDLRVIATDGAFADRGEMLAVLDGLADPTVVAVAEERLIADTQVDASTADETILVPGRIIGLDVAAGPQLTSVWVADGRGRTLGAADHGEPVVVLERNFADFYDLPAEGTVRVAGDTELERIGVGSGPEYFFVTTDDGGFFAQANFAALFTSLGTAQALAGRPGQVNDLVIGLAPGVDVGTARVDVETAFEASGLDLGTTVMTRDDEDAYRLLYDDIDGDRQFWNVLAGLILAGAAFGAFNLSSRMVEAQRREIGIAMAIGMSRRQLAIRPMLVGIEIAVVGVVLGVIVGLLAIAGLRPVYTSFLPMPVWITDFQPANFARGAALGFVLPILATAWPVWRAVRVTPVDAIATVHRNARSGLSPLLRRLPWPRSAFRRMPLGNVLRTPRRTLLTALGIGAAVATLVAIFGMLDSFVATMDRNDTHVLGEHPDRVAVGMQGFVAETDPLVEAVRSSPSVGATEPVLVLGGTLASGAGEGFDVLVEAVELDSDVWQPTYDAGPEGAGVVVSRTAADDLGVGIGDEVVLTHPTRTATGFAIVDTRVRVAGIHTSPFRFDLYVDRSDLDLFGAEGLLNQLSVLPAEGATPDDVERELFGLTGVASVQPVAASSQVVRDSIDDFTAVFQVLQIFILVLALLIAYNATSINADERARERATLFAFGLPVRRVLGLEIAEGLLYGLLGTLIGVVLGAFIVRWLTTSVLASTLPDLQLDVVLSAETVLTAVVLGVLAVGIAPLLTIRRLRRMDVPGTLRVVE